MHLQEFFATQTRRTLKVLQSLQNGTYEIGTLVKMSCKIQNATSYRWLKDGQYLSLNETAFRIKSRELVIKSIGEQTSGVYECVGTDEEGNAGRTTARIKLLGNGICAKYKRIKVISPCTGMVSTFHFDFATVLILHDLVHTFTPYSNPLLHSTITPEQEDYIGFKSCFSLIDPGCIRKKGM